MTHLLIVGVEMEAKGRCPYELLRTALSSPIMILTAMCRSEFDFVMAAEKGLVDLFLALEQGWDLYVNEKLNHLSHISNSDWSKILLSTLDVVHNDKFGRIAENCFRAARQIARMVTSIQTNLLDSCLRLSRRTTKASLRPFAAQDILLELRPSAVAAGTQHNCGDNTGVTGNLYCWWIEQGRTEPLLTQHLLHIIRRVCAPNDAVCERHGTAYHLLLSLCLQEHEAAMCPLRWFLLFSRLEISPCIRHNNKTPLQLALVLKRHPKLMSARFFSRGRSPNRHACDLSAVVDVLEYYEKRIAWPDFGRTRYRLNANRADANWKLDEAGSV